MWHESWGSFSYSWLVFGRIVTAESHLFGFLLPHLQYCWWFSCRIEVRALEATLELNGGIWVFLSIRRPIQSQAWAFLPIYWDIINSLYPHNLLCLWCLLQHDAATTVRHSRDEVEACKLPLCPSVITVIYFYVMKPPDTCGPFRFNYEPDLSLYTDFLVDLVLFLLL